MSSGVNTSNRVPCNGMALAFGYAQVAMWANPALVIFCSSSRGGLHRVLNSTLYLGALDSDAHFF